MSTNFNGFSIKTIEFLYSLRANNSKSWFEENRQDYEKYLLGPMKELVVSLTDTVHEIDPAIDTRPAIGKTISRIYRDLRFSNDKSPLRSRLWLSFKQIREDSSRFPGFYFEIDPEYYCFGMGVYSAEKTYMDSLRRFLKENPEEFLKAAAFYFSPENCFSLEGEAYKRLDSSNVREELKSWYIKKSFYLECLRPVDRRLFGKELSTDISKAYKEIAPLYRLLCRIHERSL